MAEVLITLGIIGIVAAITLPGLIQNYQAKVRQNQFKKAYSTFFNAVKLAQAKLDYPVGWFYWSNGSLCNEVCTKRNEVYNNCTAWSCEDGSPIPQNQNGIYDDVKEFEKELFNKTLNVVKFCQDHSLANGCIKNDYRGTDIIIAEQNPDAEFPPDPNGDFSENNIKNNYPSWILKDGTLIIKYGKLYAGVPIYTIDINGHKGPNKWGYDIFTFMLKGDSTNGITQLAPASYVVEKGGMSTDAMMKNLYK